MTGDPIFERLVGERLFDPATDERQEPATTMLPAPPRHELRDEPEHPRLRPRNDLDAAGELIR